MGFFDTTVKKELGKCIYCGAPMIGKVREKDGKITSAPDASTRDNQTFMCPTCYKSKDLVEGDISLKENKEELLVFLKKKHLVSPEEFTPTKRVHRMASLISPRSNLVYMELDEERELINIPVFDQGIMFDDLCDRIYKFTDILDFKIIDNGSSVMEGSSLIGAAVGGALFGGAGAIVGSTLSSRKSVGKCSQLSVKIIINDIHESTRYLNILGDNSEFTDSYSRESATYGSAMKIAEQCISILTIILKRNHELSSPQPANTSNSGDAGKEDIIENIKKLSELKEMGILTEAEFESKKKELMDRL